MRQAELDLKEAAPYYRDVIGAGLYIQDSWDDADVAVRADAYKHFEPIVCGMAPDDVVDQNTGGAFAAFAFDGTKFDLVLRNLEPQGYGDASQHPVFHAGNVCRALHESQTHGSVGRRTVG